MHLAAVVDVAPAGRGGRGASAMGNGWTDDPNFKQTDSRHRWIKGSWAIELNNAKEGYFVYEVIHAGPSQLGRGGRGPSASARGAKPVAAIKGPPPKYIQPEPIGKRKFLTFDGAELAINNEMARRSQKASVNPAVKTGGRGARGGVAINAK